MTQQHITASPPAPPSSSPVVSGSWMGSLLCRAIVPAWLCTGALVKLLDRSPALLPKPVRAIYSWIASFIGMSAEADLTRFFDVALRATISIEFTLAAAMILLPRLSRTLAAITLTMFVIILTSVVMSGAASCGCFGSKGPSPIVVLTIDALLLAGVLFLKPRKSKTSGALAGAWVGISALSIAITFGVPAKMMVEAQPLESVAVTSVAAEVAPSTAAGATTTTAGATTTAASATKNVTKAAWPTAPSQLQPYYMPQVDQWVGKPLRAQPLAALILQPLPENLEQGKWIVMFFREDCEHCHAVLENYFMTKLPAPTLLVSIPDSNPAAALPNPCSDCKVTAFMKGPEYVVATPILMSLENGIIKRVCMDSEDLESLQATLEFR